MKYLLTLLLLFPLICHAQNLPFPGPCNSVSVVCSTSTDSVRGNFLGTSSDIGSSAFACTKWVLGDNITITEYVSRFRYYSGDVKVCLLPHSSGTDLPDGTTCITGTDKTLNTLTTGSIIDHTFTLASTVNVDSGTYWVCNIEVSGAERSFEYHAISGRGCYGAASCSTGENNVANGSIDIYGCVR